MKKNCVVFHGMFPYIIKENIYIYESIVLDFLSTFRTRASLSLSIFFLLPTTPVISAFRLPVREPRILSPPLLASKDPTREQSPADDCKEAKKKKRRRRWKTTSTDMCRRWSCQSPNDPSRCGEPSSERQKPAAVAVKMKQGRKENENENEEEEKWDWAADFSLAFALDRLIHSLIDRDGALIPFKGRSQPQRPAPDRTADMFSRLHSWRSTLLHRKATTVCLSDGIGRWGLVHRKTAADHRSASPQPTAWLQSRPHSVLLPLLLHHRHYERWNRIGDLNVRYVLRRFRNRPPLQRVYIYMRIPFAFFSPPPLPPPTP